MSQKHTAENRARYGRGGKDAEDGELEGDVCRYPDLVRQ